MGWMIAWGALFIKLFGFSFFVLRMSILPFALASIFLFHRILDRFGVAQRNANIGALTLALSPIFFPVATSFMTDVPGLFAILLCVYMCQRAIAAASERATVLWLVSAAMLNVAGGTVRQAAWLGALAMVPSTGWYLRKRRGALFASLLSASISVVFVFALMHWFYSRPQYFVDPRMNIAHPHIRTLLEEMLKMFLLVLLLALPMLAAWWPTLRNTPRASLLRTSAILGLIALCLGDAARRGRLGAWGAPWFPCTLSTFPLFGPPNIDQLFGSSVRIPTWLGVTLTVLTASAALLVAEQLYNRKMPRRPATVDATPGLGSLLWVFGPFSFIYVLLVASRAENNQGVADRYALCLLPFAIALLLLLYQRSIGPVLPVVTVLVVAVFALDAVGGTHDYYADQRAGDTAIRGLTASGVPETSISQSENRDAWLQVSVAGHMHWNGPAELDRGPNPPLPRRVPAVPCSSYIEPVTPVMQPEYYILFSPSPCLQPSRYPPISYTAWLPPFHRNEYIEQPRYTLP